MIRQSLTDRLKFNLYGVCRRLASGEGSENPDDVGQRTLLISLTSNTKINDNKYHSFVISGKLLSEQSIIDVLSD